MRQTTILVVGLLVIAGIPFASASDTSVGFRDAVGVAPAETPDQPSVDADLHARLVATGCYEADGELGDDVAGAAAKAQEELEAGLASDPACGLALYNQGTQLEQASPEDQVLSDVVTSFDVVWTSYVGNYGLSDCVPWCNDLGPEREATEATWLLLHQTFPETFPEEEAPSEGFETEYAVNLAFPNAGLVLQDVTNAWDGNGPLYFGYDQTLVGFLLGSGGVAIDDVELTRLVTDLKGSNQLGTGAFNGICGFTPDADIAIGATDAGFCEINFAWIEEDKSPDTDFDGTESCDSAAYFCGQLTPAWYAQFVTDSTFSDSNSADDYDIYHFVVAPTISGCQGAAEPGFLFDTGAPMDFLAHDLDVYTPLATAAGSNGFTGVGDAADAVAAGAADAAADIAFESLDDALGLLPEGLVPEEVGDAADTAVTTAIDATYLVIKDDLIEPNSVGDTSRSVITAERTIETDRCSPIIDTGETPETVDPWVDYIDTSILSDNAVGGNPVSLYEDTETEHDSSNTPGTVSQWTLGYVGVFTDKNDDGDYDQASNNELFDIEQNGAYPMFWDMTVDETGQPDGGCNLGYSTTTLAQDMEEAGYGPRTGLVQAVYLKEPTAMWTFGYQNVLEYLDGETVAVFMSQAPRALLEADDDVTKDVVDTVIDKALAESGLTQDDVNVVFPGTSVGLESDFDPQCNEDTGGYISQWRFVHDCRTSDCSGDTMVTGYMFEVTDPDGHIGGNGVITPLAPNDVPVVFDAHNLWLDVDPMDGDSSRNFQSEEPPSA